MRERYFEAVVLGRRTLTPRICEFRLGAADGSALPMAEAGSHIELRFGGADGRFCRHYSLVGPLTIDEPGEPFWRISVQRENRARGSAFLHDQIRPGARLKVSQPINAFRLARNQAHTLLVAGGVGVTPIYTMARSLRQRQAPFSLMYAGLNRSAMAYVEDLLRLCGDRMTLHETEREGVPDLKALLSVQPEGSVAYICGPGPMIEALRAAGDALRWPRQNIRFELFNAAHRPDDAAFEVATRSGRTIQVGAGVTLLEALEATGIDTLSDCRRGECGLCVTDVVACDGAIDHRDRYLDPTTRDGNTKLAICCSRFQGTRLELDV